MIKPAERNIYLDTESGIYIIRKFKKGKDPLWHSTGERSIKAARAMKDEVIANWLGNRPKSTRRLFSQLFDDVLQVKATKAAKTYKSANDAIKHLRPWFEENCTFIDQLNEATWEKYIVAQRQKNKTRQLKHDREILTFTLNLGRKKDWIHKIFPLRKPDSPKEAGRYVSDDEIERLIEHAPTNNLRFHIQIAAKMGMRKTEILALSWDRVDLKGAWLTLYAENTKTKKKRFVPIPDDLLPEFKKRFDEKEGIFVFPANGTLSRPVGSHKSAWDTCRENAKVECRFHDLRHRAITDMLAAGISETDVSKITGASPIVIARIYHHLRTDTLERVRNLSCGKFVGKENK